MTLEQTTQRILAAAEAQDLAALQAASKMRDDALDALRSLSPTSALCDDVTASIAAGEKAMRAIRVVKQRLHNESRRLTRIEEGFVRVLRPAEMHRIDCKG